MKNYTGQIVLFTFMLLLVSCDFSEVKELGGALDEQAEVRVDNLAKCVGEKTLNRLGADIAVAGTLSLDISDYTDGSHSSLYVLSTHNGFSYPLSESEVNSYNLKIDRPVILALNKSGSTYKISSNETTYLSKHNCFTQIHATAVNRYQANTLYNTLSTTRLSKKLALIYQSGSVTDSDKIKHRNELLKHLKANIDTWDFSVEIFVDPIINEYGNPLLDCYVRDEKNELVYKTNISPDGTEIKVKQRLSLDSCIGTYKNSFYNENPGITNMLVVFQSGSPCGEARLGGNFGFSFKNTSGCYASGVMAHEFGHQFGIGHAQTRKSYSSSTYDTHVNEYGEDESIMGWSYSKMGRFNAYNLNKIGALKKVKNATQTETILLTGPRYDLTNRNVPSDVFDAIAVGSYIVGITYDHNSNAVSMRSHTKGYKNGGVYSDSNGTLISSYYDDTKSLLFSTTNPGGSKTFSNGVRLEFVSYDTSTGIAEIKIDYPGDEGASTSCANKPSNSKLCIENENVSNINVTLVSECSGSKACEATCENDYMISGTQCVPDTRPKCIANREFNEFSALGLIACPGTEENLAQNTNSNFVHACNPSNKCEYTCPAGKIYYRSSNYSPPTCIDDPNGGGDDEVNPPVSYSCNTDSLILEGTKLCSGSGSNLSSNLSARILADGVACNPNNKCEYYCDQSLGYERGSNTNRCQKIASSEVYSCEIKDEANKVNISGTRACSSLRDRSNLSTQKYINLVSKVEECGLGDVCTFHCDREDYKVSTDGKSCVPKINTPITYSCQHGDLDLRYARACNGDTINLQSNVATTLISGVDQCNQAKCQFYCLEPNYIISDDGKGCIEKPEDEAPIDPPVNKDPACIETDAVSTEHASICSSDQANPLTDTNITLLDLASHCDSSGSRKCQFFCNSGYEIASISGKTRCVKSIVEDETPVTYSCTGTKPALKSSSNPTGVVMCGADEETGLLAASPYVYTGQCRRERKCEFRCNTGEVFNAGKNICETQQVEAKDIQIYMYKVTKDANGKTIYTSASSFKMGQDVIFYKVLNAGPNARACIDLRFANGQTYTECSRSDGDSDVYKDMNAASSEWSYASSKWTLTTDLSKPTYLEQGSFSIWWYNPDSGVDKASKSFTIQGAD